MSLGTALVTIVFILAISVLVMQRAENRKETRDDSDTSRHRELERERDEARRELDEIKERVKVLERIATDPARRTAEEIENLRDD